MFVSVASTLLFSLRIVEEPLYVRISNIEKILNRYKTALLMNIAIISSTKDPASVNIKKALLKEYEFVIVEDKFEDNDVYGYLVGDKDIKLYTIDSELITTEDLDKKIEADMFIFISKHRAKDDRAVFTCHPIGNFTEAKMGGKDKALVSIPIFYFKEISNNLNENSESIDYGFNAEATHHGPFLEKPSLFVEIGSTKRQWSDRKAAHLAAKSVLESLEKENKKLETYAVVGGMHYNYNANKLLLRSDFGVGHICPKYNFEFLDNSMIKQLLEKSRTKKVLLDWKGLGKEKQRILELLERNKIKYERSDKFFS